MAISTFFEQQLRAPLRNIRWSWGAYDADRGRIFLRVWEDEIENDGTSERVHVAWKGPPGESLGRKERHDHVEMLRRGVPGFGVVCRAVDPDTEGTREIADFDDKMLVRFGRISDTSDLTFAEITGRIDVNDLPVGDASIWSLKPGDRIRRKKLHDRYGGRRQGGIGPSAESPNVFVFTDAEVGQQHGYVDGWKSDGCFHYTGEGQHGDQELRQGNRAVLQAGKDGRALRLFQGAGGTVEYLGRFTLDSTEPYYTTDAPETSGGPIRSVIVFRLRPVDTDPPRSGDDVRPKPQLRIDVVPIEANNVERMYIDPSREQYEAERRESGLVQRFRDYLELRGYEVERFRIVPPQEVHPLFCDMYVEKLDLLIEAKGSVDRQSLRMAIGQLIDYRRFRSGQPRCAVLLPERPRTDLLDLLSAAAVECIWEQRTTFESTGELAKDL